MNGKRSNYDFLFISGRRCFYVDPCKDHRIDYFYSWESFFSGFFGSVYVWCRNQLLYSYQKLIIFILTALLFSFPVYAEDERYEFQNIQNESLYLQGYDLNQYYNSETHNNLLAINPNDESINVYSDEYKIHLLDYYAQLTSSDAIRGYFTYKGLKPDEVSLSYSYDGSNIYSYNLGSRNIYDNYLLAPAGTRNQDLIYFYTLTAYYDDVPYSYDVDVVVNKSDLSSEYSLIKTFGGYMTAYLEQVATVFTWILTHITELITFILGNPFLAVSLVLFMCGAVISFYVRIKNS